MLKILSEPDNLKLLTAKEIYAPGTPWEKGMVFSLYNDENPKRYKVLAYVDTVSEEDKGSIHNMYMSYKDKGIRNIIISNGYCILSFD